MKDGGVMKDEEIKGLLPIYSTMIIKSVYYHAIFLNLCYFNK
jgi:hypothetical protein